MKKNKIIFGAIIILLILGIGIYFLMQKYPSANNINNQNNSLLSHSGTQNNFLNYGVNISEYQFSPNLIIIPLGNNVIWTNNDPVAHTITSDNGTELASSLIATGTSYSHLFNSSGTFYYHCSIHPMMKGEVIVQ